MATGTAGRVVVVEDTLSEEDTFLSEEVHQTTQPMEKVEVKKVY